MSTPILGPLQNGTRLQFTIEYDLPQSIDSSYGDIIITDSLPASLAWYGTTNLDHKNKVIVGRIQQIIGIGFSAANNILTITIPNSILAVNANHGQKLYVEIDAVISNAALIQPNTVITNNANLTFTGIDLSGNGSTNLMLTPLDLSTVFVETPDTATPYSGTSFPIDIVFNGSFDTGVFNYDIMCDFGENLVFDPQSPDSYRLYYYLIGGPLNEIRPVTITKDSLSANVYHFIFANTAAIAGKIISLSVVPKTKYDNLQGFRFFGTAPENIVFKYSIQIGGAQSPVNTVLIPFAKKITLRKLVVSGTQEQPQKIALTKNVITR